MSTLNPSVGLMEFRVYKELLEELDKTYS